MKAEIIAVGSELTSGEKLDTNSQWLSCELADLGISVVCHTTVADDVDVNIAAFRLASERADIVLITGGLGPTKDDLTREVMAAVAGVELALDPNSLAQIEEMFASRGRPMPASNRVQAMFPRGAVALTNENGTAPGVFLSLARSGRRDCLMAAMPGVPSEMKRMFRNHVVPLLPGGNRPIRRRQINTFGYGESQAEELLGDLTARGRDPEIGITAHDATISLRICAHGDTEAECVEKLDQAEQRIRQQLGDVVFGVGIEDMEAAVVQTLRASNSTLSTVEVSTRGDLAARLSLVVQGAVPSSAAISGAVVLDGNLRESSDDPRCEFGPFVVLTSRDSSRPFFAPAASPPTGIDQTSGFEFARSLAVGCRSRFQTTFALAVGDYGNEELPDGRVVAGTWVSLASADGSVVTIAARSTGNPAIFAARTSKLALDLLRRHLHSLPQPAGADVQRQFI